MGTTRQAVKHIFEKCQGYEYRNYTDNCPREAENNDGYSQR